MVKQKIVIKVAMTGQKRRAKAMALVSGFAGVTSMAIKGDDQMEVVGEGVDTVCLVCCLRKNKFGHAEILLVEEVKEKKEEKKEEKKPCCSDHPYCYCGYPVYRPQPWVVCEEQLPNYGCSIM